MATPPNGRARLSGKLLLLALLVVIGHLWLTGSVLDNMASLHPDAPRIERMQANYVSEVRLTSPPTAPVATPAIATPPATGARPPRRKRPVRPPQAASAASEPSDAAAEAVASAASEPDASPADTKLAASDQAASQAPLPPSQPASATNASGNKSDTPFIWPEATRVSYVLQGHYRGPVHGQSTVEWIRREQRYQVHIDASVGPSFAPLGSWRLSSEGEIRPEGLHPRRYENVNRLLIRSARAKVIELGDTEVSLPDGKKQERLPGLQDPASFMIQVAYQFILDPRKARPGSSFEMTVLTLRKPEPLVFDVIEQVDLDTPMGRIPTLHVRPRKAVQDDGALPADVWFAPGLQYLPVRIAMRMKDESWLEMSLSRAPQQTPGRAAGEPAASAPAANP